MPGVTIDGGNPPDVGVRAKVARHRFERRRQESTRVTGSDADPHASDVDAEPDAGPHAAQAAPAETAARTPARASSTPPALVPPPCAT